MNPRQEFLIRRSFAASTLNEGCAARGNSAFVQPRGVEVAAGPYSVRGAPGEFGPANLGRIGNAGFIVGGDGVVAADTGTSHRRGLALGEDAAQCARRQ